MEEKKATDYQNLPQDRLVLISEDDPITQEVILDTLIHGGFKCLIFPNAEALLATPFLDDAGCVVSDVCMLGMGGVALQEQLAMSHPHLPVILISAYGDIALAVNALKSGAYDFIEKPFVPGNLIDCVSDALKCYEHAQNEFIRLKTLAKRFSQVTPRELEIIEQIVAGKGVKEAARTLRISPRTVEHHRSNLLKKVNAVNIHELIHLYTRWRNSNNGTKHIQPEHVEALNNSPEPVLQKTITLPYPVPERFVWSDELSVGVKRLDEHHQQMIDIVNRLIDAISEGSENPCEIVPKTLNDLSEYCHHHFTVEEAYMHSIGYSGLEMHILEHKSFFEKMEAFTIASACEVIDPVELYRFASNWLREHVLGSDMLYRNVK